MYDVVVKKFTFAVSSRDELLVFTIVELNWHSYYWFERSNETNTMRIHCRYVQTVQSLLIFNRRLIDLKQCNEKHSVIFKCIKIVFGRGSAHEPAGGAFNGPPYTWCQYLLVGWGGWYPRPNTPSTPSSSVSAPLAYPVSLESWGTRWNTGHKIPTDECSLLDAVRVAWRTVVFSNAAVL